MDRRWEDLPVPSSCKAIRRSIFDLLSGVREYLVSIPEEIVQRELNKRTPAPWGEMRPTYLNVWGGVVEHVIQHAMQIAARKERIRYYEVYLTPITGCPIKNALYSLRDTRKNRVQAGGRE